MTLPEEQIRADERAGMVRLFIEVERLRDDGALTAVLVERVFAYLDDHAAARETGGGDRADLADAIARFVLEWQARDGEPSVPMPPATLGEAIDGMADEEPF